MCNTSLCTCTTIRPCSLLASSPFGEVARSLAKGDKQGTRSLLTHFARNRELVCGLPSLKMLLKIASVAIRMLVLFGAQIQVKATLVVPKIKLEILTFFAVLCSLENSVKINGVQFQVLNSEFSM